MSDYGSIITIAGAAAEAAANASGTPLKLTMFVVGDGGGAPVTPDPAQTELINEVYRGSISGLSVNPDDATQLIATLIIPGESGGYVIRELGIVTEDGTLYSVSNYADQNKPSPDSGMAVSVKIDYMLAVSNKADITFVLPAGEYLTEVYADTLYLRQDQRLSEIAGQGEEAQAAARGHLALGELATKDSLTASDTGALPLYPPPLTVDLNTLGVTESAGVYCQTVDVNALPELNYPIAQSGTLLVTPSAYGCQQEYTTFGSGRKFVRGLTASFDGVSGPWGAWREYYGESNPPPAQDLSGYYTKAEADARFVQSFQFGAVTQITASGNQYATSPGCVMCIIQDSDTGNWPSFDSVDAVYQKPAQININDTWLTVAG